MNLQNDDTRDEMMRQLNELSIRSGRQRQSKQTGFIHLNYHPDDENCHDTIPVVENGLFALALFQSKMTENIMEARTLLEKILHFQTADGNFPVYLHEYPQCRDRFVGAHLLPALYWILKVFHAVVGADLLPRLQTAATRLLNFVLTTHQHRPASDPLATKIACTTIGFGHLFHDKTLSEQGETLIKNAQNSLDNPAWHSPGSLAEIMTGLQMVYPSIAEGPWKNLWSHVVNTWHLPTLSYAGAPLREFQTMYEPQTTLYDLFLGYFSGHLSTRALKDKPYHLQACLIHPSLDRIAGAQYPVIEKGKIADCAWMMHQQKNYAYALLEQKEPGRLCPDKGRHIFRFACTGKDRMHTFVCQGGNSQHTTFEVKDSGIDFYFDLAPPADSDDREKNREILFYFDLPEKASFTVKGVPTNTFKIDDVVEVKTDAFAATMTFTVEKGDGRFFGHVMPGNRLSQLAIKGEQRFNVYDWQLFMRSMSRSEHCRIKVALHIHNS